MAVLELTRRMAAGGALFLALVGAQAPQPDYAVGQVWEYRTRPGDEGSLLRIQQVEESGPAPGPIYHISVIGVRFRQAPLSGQLAHLPVSRATLDASVTRLSATTPSFPDVSPGIAQWREVRGGVFTIPLAEVVDMVERMVAQQSSQP
jgi:hypothetical protein